MRGQGEEQGEGRMHTIDRDRHFCKLSPVPFTSAPRRMPSSPHILLRVLTGGPAQVSRSLPGPSSTLPAALRDFSAAEELAGQDPRWGRFPFDLRCSMDEYPVRVPNRDANSAQMARSASFRVPGQLWTDIADHSQVRMTL